MQKAATGQAGKPQTSTKQNPHERLPLGPPRAQKIDSLKDEDFLALTKIKPRAHIPATPRTQLCDMASPTFLLMEIGRLDRDLFLQLNRGAGPRDLTRRAARLATRVGDTDCAVLHALALAALAPEGQHGIYALTIGGAMLLATACSQILKRAIRRQRPSVAIQGFQPSSAPPDAYSFPSGHSCAAIALAVGAGALNPVVGAIETLLALAIAVSRIRLGAHYPVDVVAGLALGAAVGLAWVRFLAPA